MNPARSDEPAGALTPLRGWAAALFERAPVCSALIGTDGTVLAVNTAFADLVGRPAEALAGKDLVDLADPRDTDATAAGMHELLGGLTTTFVQALRYVRPGGALVLARTSTVALRARDGTVVGLLAQATTDTPDESAAARSEALMRRVFAASPIPKVMMDQRRTVLAVNPAMLALLETSPADVTWSRLFDAASPQDVATVEALLDGPEGTIEFDCHVLVPGRPARPVRAITTTAEDANGDRRAIVEMVDVGEHEEALAGAVHRLSHDQLTSLGNARLFEDTIAAALTDANRPRRRRHHRRAGVFIIDLDRFAEINDGLGRAAGDDVLVEVARRLERVCHRADTACRIGGDEFGILVDAMSGEFDAIQFSVAILRAMSEPFSAGGTAVHVGASIGFVLVPDDAIDPLDAMRKADSAQARAKQLASGWAAYSTEIDDIRLHRLRLARDLADAIDSGELGVEYQPLFGQDGRIKGFEALARWTHPDHGSIAPDFFIPLAEQAHHMKSLTASVLRQSVTQCAAWREAGHDVYVAVNLAPSLLHDDSAAALVTAELARAHLEPSHLTLEITEGRLADGSDPMVSLALARLHGLGVRLSIDDFGTGYSSLAYLKTLPVVELKIDRSFVANIDEDPRDVAIVRALVQLAKTLGLEVVVEGVESTDAASTLRALGCDTLQGFALARPMPASRATDRLRAQTAHVPTARLDSRPMDAGPRQAAAHRSARVLAVAKDPAVCAILRSVLEGDEHQVVEAGDGEQALMDVAARRPDLVIVDHDLGEGLNGIETAVLLRSTGYDGPVIVFSGVLGHDLTAHRFPLDVWPVARDDEGTLLALVRGSTILTPAAV